MPASSAARNLHRIDDFEALDGPVTLVANYAGPATLATLSKALPGRKRFILPVTTVDSELAAMVGEGDRLLQLPADVDLATALAKDDKSEGEHQVVFFQRLPRPPLGLGELDPLALEVAASYSAGLLMPVCVVASSHTRYAVATAPARELAAPAELGADAKQDWANVELTRLFERAAYRSWRPQQSLAHAVVAAARDYGMKHEMFTQTLPVTTVINYRRLLTGAFALGAELGKRHAPGSRIALMLPTSAGAAVAFCACHVAGLVPVMLNFSSGNANILSACSTAQVKEVLTARAMLKKLPAAKSAADALAKEGQTVTCLEDMRDGLSLPAKLTALARSFFPEAALAALGGGRREAGHEAVVLFTSGSEGVPKGVALSHGNLLANCSQILSRVAFGPEDRIFNSLPLFHSFGLLGGLSIPLIGGIHTLQFPSPLLYKEIPVELRKFQATILFSTSTFFGKYGATATAEDLASLRLMFAGGEKLQPGVRSLWEDKFNKHILEGYGVTETSPGLAVSLAHLERIGSPGILLAEVDHRLAPVDDIADGGVLEVAGPNVMLGYILADSPGVVQPPADGWYSTGDVVRFDELGYPFIVGRLKRFAKIAGEMVPLGRVEEALHALVGDEPLAVLARQDKERGESLLLLCQDASIDRAKAQQALAKAELPELWAPRAVVVVDEVPLLPTGKVNYPAAQALADEQAGG